jgi:16S rRNA (guanine966-N2)-methyltransferase
MRIIAGTFKGRRLEAPKGLRVRPTSDSLRETLFNVLGATVEGARVLDAFAGTGALGLEALSRGAAHATFVERDRLALAALERNVERCGVRSSSVVIRDDFLQYGARREAQGAFDLVLLDPPYDLVELAEVVAVAGGLVGASGRIVLEHSRRRESPEQAAELPRVRILHAGDSALSFYARAGFVSL